VAIVVASSLCDRAVFGAEPSELDRKAARSAVQQGDECVQKGDLKCALKAYRFADEIMGVPTTSIEVVHVELKLGHLVEAFEACYRTTRHPEKPNEPPPFTKARKEARELIGSLKKRIPRVTIEVRLADSDAVPQVKIDDKIVESYSDAPMNPGDHLVTVTAKGHLPATASLSLAEGDTKTVTIDLAREPAATGPIVPPKPSKYWPIAYAGFGVAGVGVVVGAITGALSLNNAGALAGECDGEGTATPGRCPAASQETLDRARALASASTASFVIGAVGGVVAITGVVLAVRDKRTKPTDAVTLAPLSDGFGRLAFGLTLTSSAGPRWW
jgi:hypothetical protein